MTDTDYNSRVRNLLSPYGGGASIDYRTDYYVLPRILAMIDNFGGWQVARVTGKAARFFMESNVVRDGVLVNATGATLLLAAGALLLKLAEGKS